MSDICPFLRAAGGEQRCGSDAGRAASGFIPGGFLQRTCLTQDFEGCPRYVGAMAADSWEAGVADGSDGQPAHGWVASGPGLARWLAMAAGAAALLIVGCVVLLSVAALLTGGLGLARPEAAVYAPPSATPPPPTDIPTATAVATLPPTASPAPAATDTPPVTPTLALTVPSGLPEAITATVVVEPSPTATRKPPAPTATRGSGSPRPTSMPSPVPSRSVTPTATPTATPLGCAGDETMTFVPASPPINEPVSIEVRSRRAHPDVSLTGPAATDFIGVATEGATYVWSWQVEFSQPGTYAFTFHVQGGRLVCIADEAVTVTAPTATPTPTRTPTPTPTRTPPATPTLTPTPEPTYSLTLALQGEADREIPPGEETDYVMLLTNTGNVAETFDFGAELLSGLPAGWQVKYCDTRGCYDYTVPSRPIDNLAPQAVEPLSIKLIPPPEAPDGVSVSVRLWVQSRHGPRADQIVTGTVRR